VLRHLADRAHHRLRMFRQTVLRKGEPELRWLRDHFSDLDVAVDVGANVGFYSEVLSRVARTVITLEPNGHCASWLRAVLPRNCQVVEKAASDRVSEEVLRIPLYGRRLRESRGTIAPDNQLDNPAMRGITEQRVVCEPLDRILAGLDLAGRRISFIKIDVEGHELAVLRGAGETLRTHHPALLVETENQHGAPVREVFGLVEALGYRGQVLRGDALVPVDAAGFLKLQENPSGRFINNVLFRVVSPRA
jgi:FkbM family methyltransferase